MPLIPFPAVAAFPGVPQLARNPVISDLTTAVNLLTGDDPFLGGFLAEPQWGVYDQSGSPVALFDAFIEIEHAKEYRLSDYPVEQGAFESYNKVETPFEQRVTFAKGGPVSDRSGFLADIEAATASLDLYTVVTPEITYVNANIVRHTYRRRAENGVSMLIVELTISEVRVGVTAEFTNTASPNGAATQNGGTVLPQTPTAAQAGAAAGGAT